MLLRIWAVLRQGPASFHWDPETTPLASLASPCIAAALYVASLAVLKRRPGGEIRVKAFEVFHNGLLVVWALTMVAGIVYGAHDRVQADGDVVDALLCTKRDPSRIWDGPLGYFTYLFYLSKYWELLDTVVLALRQKPTIFLHVYHHGIMLFVVWSWFAYPWMEAPWWCSFVNSCIHTLMYYYYTVTVLGVSPWWKKWLTSLQILQFISGCVMVGIHLYHHYFLTGCTSNPYTALASLTVNLSFLALFSAFYRDSYGRKAAKTL
jgi:fatty acid elongase 3